MEITPNERKAVNQKFLSVISDNSAYITALELVRQVSGNGSKIWLIGSLVYGSIASSMYSTNHQNSDLDFIVETLKRNYRVRNGWQRKENSFGNPKFVYGNLQADIVPLCDCHYIQSNRLKPSIDNFFKGSPLNVQAIAFDVHIREIVGDVGILAILERKVRINNLEEAKNTARLKSKTLNQYAQDIATKLEFDYIQDSAIF